MTTITFADGRTFEVPPGWHNPDGSSVHGLDDYGNPMTHGHDIWWGLTLCCGATFKGMEGGVGCRSCYELDPGGSDTPWGPVTQRAEPVAVVWQHRLHRDGDPVLENLGLAWRVEVDLVIPTAGEEPLHLTTTVERNTRDRTGGTWRITTPTPPEGDDDGNPGVIIPRPTTKEA